MSVRAQTDRTDAVPLHDQEPALATLRFEVLAGLSQSPKFLPSHYLYDSRGAQLFERICELPEYYLTRTELGILETNMASIAASVGPEALLIEPGSGDGVKSMMLLSGLERPAGFVPIDISRSQLIGLAGRVAERFPGLEIAPVCANFMDDPALPSLQGPVRRKLAFLPGSTIGNFDREGAISVLSELRRMAGRSGCILIGVDLAKSPDIIEPAYDDAAGVSREFAMNYLTRLNRELEADFQLEQFEYEAPYRQDRGRVEMALVSSREQVVRVSGQEIHFRRGERVRTEYSYKFTSEAFRELCTAAGLLAERVWTDPRQLFSVQLLVSQG